MTGGQGVIASEAFGGRTDVFAISCIRVFDG